MVAVVVAGDAFLRTSLFTTFGGIRIAAGNSGLDTFTFGRSIYPARYSFVLV